MRFLVAGVHLLCFYVVSFFVVCVARGGGVEGGTARCCILFRAGCRAKDFVFTWGRFSAEGSLGTVWTDVGGDVMGRLVGRVGRHVTPGRALTGFLAGALYVKGRTICHELHKRMTFAFSRITIVSRGLKVSVSRVVNGRLSGQTAFSLGLRRSPSPVRDCCRVLRHCLEVFGCVEGSSDAAVCATTGVVPFALCSTCRDLSGFHLYH